MISRLTRKTWTGRTKVRYRAEVLCHSDVVIGGMLPLLREAWHPEEGLVWWKSLGMFRTADKARLALERFAVANRKARQRQWVEQVLDP